MLQLQLQLQLVGYEKEGKESVTLKFIICLSRLCLCLCRLCLPSLTPLAPLATTVLLSVPQPLLLRLCQQPRTAHGQALVPTKTLAGRRPQHTAVSLMLEPVASCPRPC